MTNLTYETNKNLLDEMKRIWPEFEPEGRDVMAIIPVDPDKIAGKTYPFSGERTRILAPIDLVQFLQIAWEDGLIQKENTHYCTNIITNLLFGHKIFLSDENFESGVIWFIDQLKEIKL